MSAEEVFSAVNLVALVAWLGLLFLPSKRWVTDGVAQIAVPALLAVAYIVLIVQNFDPAGFSNFTSLAGIAALQSSPWLLLAGWLHYLAFDLFVGAWEVRTARAEGIPHLLIVPSLFFTFMLGPAGLLLFLLTRFAVRRRLLPTV
jgi:hypothetical protein